MKRSAALRDLSVDHHHSLVQAHRLVKAGQEPASIPAVVESFLEFWETDVRRHFREEEEILLPVAVQYDPSLAHAPAVGQMLAEHIEIRSLVLQIAASHADTRPSLAADLGTRLEAHVRLEERVVFPLIEERVPLDGMEELLRRLVHDEGSAAQLEEKSRRGSGQCKIRS